MPLCFGILEYMFNKLTNTTTVIIGTVFDVSTNSANFTIGSNRSVICMPLRPPAHAQLKQQIPLALVPAGYYSNLLTCTLHSAAPHTGIQSQWSQRRRGERARALHTHCACVRSAPHHAFHYSYTCINTHTRTRVRNACSAYTNSVRMSN